MNIGQITGNRDNTRCHHQHHVLYIFQRQNLSNNTIHTHPIQYIKSHGKRRNRDYRKKSEHGWNISYESFMEEKYIKAPSNRDPHTSTPSINKKYFEATIAHMFVVLEIY